MSGGIALHFSAAFTEPGTTGGELVLYSDADGVMYASDYAAPKPASTTTIIVGNGGATLGVGDILALAGFIAAWFPGYTVTAPETFTYFGVIP